MPSSETASPGATPAIEVRFSTRAYFATGGAASGIVGSIVGMFVLLYYSTALGVPAGLVGTALAIALIFDAISDPIVGFASDRFRSRWGRRHPFMYLAILPVTALFYAVWHPPESLSHQGLFLYLVATTVPLRLLLTFFDVPSNALIPEISPDYDERTRLATYRVSFSWLMITGLSAALYGYWLRDTPEQPNGLLNVAGYQEMGLVAAGIVCAAMLICAAGLHPLIPKLRKPSMAQRWTTRDLLAGVRTTFTEPALVPLLLSGIMISTGFSIYGVLFAYQYAYFWEFTSDQLSASMLAWLLGVGIGFLAPPLLTRVPQKRVLGLLGLVGIGLSTAGCVLLNLAGLFPAAGSDARFVVLFIVLLFDMLTFLLITASLQSMIADVVERRELIGGQREEGSIFAAQTLILKTSSALGTFLGGQLLALIQFPTGDAAIDVPAQTIHNLALAWIAGNLSFYVLAFLCLLRFRMTRADHSRHLEELAERARSAGS